MGLVNRRRFLRRVGAAGVAGSAAMLSARDGVLAQATHAQGHGGGDGLGGHGLGTVGSVDNARNGFNPHDILTDFDGGEVSRDRSGRTVREYEFVASDKEIEVAPGVFFPAWTYNGRVPGPTIKATEGDRLRITLVNATSHLHTIHFHGIHASLMDGVPGFGEVGEGGQFTYDFIAVRHPPLSLSLVASRPAHPPRPLRRLHSRTEEGSARGERDGLGDERLRYELRR
jgi:FtsP/CotA-like multicopper oxidase with cupredoxin domain